MCLVIAQGNEYLHVRAVNTSMQMKLRYQHPSQAHQDRFRGSAPLGLAGHCSLERDIQHRFLSSWKRVPVSPAVSRTEQLCAPQMATVTRGVLALGGGTSPARESCEELSPSQGRRPTKTEVSDANSTKIAQ